jgi:hypothetical protein
MGMGINRHLMRGSGMHRLGIEDLEDEEDEMMLDEDEFT